VFPTIETIVLQERIFSMVNVSKISGNALPICIDKTDGVFPTMLGDIAGMAIIVRMDIVSPIAVSIADVL
jgi:hypothetical protein